MRGEKATPAAPAHPAADVRGAERMNGLALAVPVELVDAIACRVAELLADQSQPAGYLDVAEAAEYLRCPKSRIYELASAKRLAHERDGRRLLFRRSDLDAVLERQEAER